MRLLNTSIIAGGSLSPVVALAHGTHAELPYESLLHLLVHNWPLVPAMAILVVGYFLLRRRGS